jgi:membrane associated rhomboid family serine protease
VLPLKDNVPTDRFPIVTVLLIAINLLVFGWQLSFPGDRASNRVLFDARISERDENTIEYGAIPREITKPGTYCATGVGPGGRSVCGSREAIEDRTGVEQPPFWVTLFTSMFMHGGILHIGGNMLFLWIFGNNIEDSMGRLRFVLFYVLAGLAAVYTQAAIDTDSTIPTIGASGAVAGVMGAYGLLFPRARVLTVVFIIFFFTLIEIPALVMLGFWLFMQFLPVVGQLATPEIGGEGGGVAYFAHIGGFAFGLALIKLFANRYKRFEPAPRYPVY